MYHISCEGASALASALLFPEERGLSSGVMGCGHARRGSGSPETEESTLSRPLKPHDAILTNHGFLDTVFIRTIH